MTIVKIVAFVFKLIKMKKMADKVMANPKATKGGVATVAVAVLCLLMQYFGVEITPELQEGLAAIVLAVGGAYTAYRASK